MREQTGDPGEAREKAYYDEQPAAEAAAAEQPRMHESIAIALAESAAAAMMKREATLENILLWVVSDCRRVTMSAMENKGGSEVSLYTLSLLTAEGVSAHERRPVNRCCTPRRASKGCSG